MIKLKEDHYIFYQEEFFFIGKERTISMLFDGS
jgi:hypothetical protein